MGSMRSLMSVLVVLAVATSTSEGGVCFMKIKDGKMILEGDCENSGGRSILMDLERKVQAREQVKMTSRSTSGSSKTTKSPHLETTSTKTRTESTTTSIGVPCANGMIYDNKCFIPVVDRFVNYDDGVAKCESLGGQLANIYSQTHMDDVMKYIRDNRLGRDSWKTFYLGMKYDPKADKLTLRDGTDAPAGLKWYPFTPVTVEKDGEGVADYTSVLLRVISDQSSTWQYLLNVRPSYTSYVLCETE